MAVIFTLILITAFFIALKSMKDYHIPGEVHKITEGRKKRGTFIIYKHKVTHYKRG